MSASSSTKQTHGKSFIQASPAKPRPLLHYLRPLCSSLDRQSYRSFLGPSLPRKALATYHFHHPQESSRRTTRDIFQPLFESYYELSLSTMTNNNTTTPPAITDSSQTPNWINRLSANISGLLFSPTTPAASANNVQKRQPHRKLARPTTWHVSSDTLIFPQLDVSTTTPAPLVREPSVRRKKKDPPSMPTGEHNAAARSRLRHKAERRGDRSRSRRPELNPTQSLRSSRRHSSASQREVPQIMSAEQIRAQKQKNRNSSPFPLPPSQVMSAEDLRRLKELNRRSSPLPQALEAIPASPDVPQMKDPWTADEEQCMKQAALFSQRRRRRNVPDALVSPKTRFPMPTVLSPPLKSSTTALENQNPVARKKRDIAHVPASAKWYLWQVFIDEKAPLVLTNIHVDRRYSDGRPNTGWSIDTLTPRMLPAWMRTDSGVFSGADYGQRKYDRDSGYWGWSRNL